MKSSTAKTQNLEAILTKIESIPPMDLSIHTISKSCGYSPWHFQRLFHGLTGQPLGKYLRARKLTLAAQQLLQSKKGILDIALECGFNSHGAFTRSFQNYFSLSPKQYRIQSPEILPLAKPALTTAFLNHIKAQNLTPQIVEISEKKLVGIECTVVSPLYEIKASYQELIPLWKSFFKQIEQISHRTNDQFIGLAKSRSGQNEEEKLQYFAACEVNHFVDLPGNFSQITIPAQTFAVFTNQGPAGSVVHMTDYIYGTWLVDSGYLRDEGDDFEVFSKDFSFTSPTSTTDYHLPIKKQL